MALIKNEVAYNGETLNYHRLAEFEVDMATGACMATMHSWPDRWARETNAPPTVKRRFNFLWTTDDMVADAYAAVKQHPNWQGAEDA